MKASNEKLIEMLFCHYALALLHKQVQRKDVLLYTPSSREEFLCGYDSKFRNPSSFREIYIQFKAPNLTKDGFTIYITPHQHRRLRAYPCGTAFYVCPTFRDMSEIQESQQDTKEPWAFLAQYCAIDASFLPEDTRFVQYERITDPRRAFWPTFLPESDGRKKKATRRIMDKAYMDGNELFEYFGNDLLGCTIRPGDFIDRNPSYATFPQIIDTPSFSKDWRNWYEEYHRGNDTPYFDFDYDLSRIVELLYYKEDSPFSIEEDNNKNWGTCFRIT